MWSAAASALPSRHLPPLTPYTQYIDTRRAGPHATTRERVMRHWHTCGSLAALCGRPGTAASRLRARVVVGGIRSRVAASATVYTVYTRTHTQAAPPQPLAGARERVMWDRHTCGSLAAPCGRPGTAASRLRARVVGGGIRSRAAASATVDAVCTVHIHKSLSAATARYCSCASDAALPRVWVVGSTVWTAWNRGLTSQSACGRRRHPLSRGGISHR